MKLDSGILVLLFSFGLCIAPTEGFRVAAFATAINDLGHLSFVEEANIWFHRMAAIHNFTFITTTNWNNMNDGFLENIKVVVFLDTRPENPNHRSAFERFVRRGGGFMGFHFSGFALDNSAYPQNWNWYHNELIGAGQYVSNTWKPTPAVLKVEDPQHPSTVNLPTVFRSAANEWYRWERNLTTNPNINILLAIDDASFPLGTGPNPWEIWYEGYYPVVWTNRNYNMIYLNMGHNDIDYADGNRPISQTFVDSPYQNVLVLDALKWLGR